MIATKSSGMVAAAEQAAAAAQREYEALEERVRNGDQVALTDLTAARELARYRQLEVESARRQAERQATAERHARYTQIGAEARTYRPDDAALVDAYRTAVEVPEDASPALRRGLQRRRGAAITGRCVCGATRPRPTRQERQASHESPVRLRVPHRPDCPGSEQLLGPLVDAWQRGVPAQVGDV